jgi:hypothetical protein
MSEVGSVSISSGNRTGMKAAGNAAGQGIFQPGARRTTRTPFLIIWKGEVR